ncbi:alpha/beta hydrolase family protein, partial [Pseudomonas viridiflava]|uniref:alpha/beta hydrolase family protein n=1 Tax=Pseudomonas viridiflava TaxID=33069 RepID=UPI0013CED0AB
SVDPEAIAVIGTSYGGYLATILSAMRPVKWMALRVPALYWDADWDMPKQELDRDRLAHYRRSAVTAVDNRALAACKEFRGDVLLIESERDDYV